MSAFAIDHKERFETWQRGSSNLVCLQVPDEAALAELVHRAGALGVECSSFHEPDFDGALTAAAFGEGARRMLSSLPLALREKAAA